jgi:hypothetical protein
MASYAAFDAGAHRRALVAASGATSLAMSACAADAFWFTFAADSFD